MSELRECPFACGASVAERTIRFDSRHFYGSCICGATGPTGANPEEATRLWNTRPASRVEEAATKFLRCVEQYHDVIELRDDLENRHLWSRELSVMYDAMMKLRAALAEEGEEG